MNPARRPFFARPRQAFTLIEVVCSIALVVIIIYGVNRVFALTGQAVGIGQAVSEINRNARNAQSIMFNDFASAEVDGAPFLLIRSMSIAAFRNAADQRADADYAASSLSLDQIDAAIRTIDRNADGDETGPTDQTPLTALTSRTHRADMLAFFVRSGARRQTGDVGTFISDVSGNEQYVVYTHLRQPTNAAVGNETSEGQDPGYSYLNTNGTESVRTPANNPNNFYANQWVLGRKAMIMREPVETSPGSGTWYIRDSTTGQPLTYYMRTRGTSASNKNSRAPFSYNSVASLDGKGTSGAPTQQNSLYDLAGMSIGRYRTQHMKDILADTSLTNTWQDALIFRPTGFAAPTKPLTPYGAARTVPCFLEHCTQFAVEYAGDFIAQDANGNATGYAGQDGKTADEQTDGVIDFCVDPVTKTRSIRWYGFPRDTNDDGLIPTKLSGGIGAVLDTLPARDVVRTINSSFDGFLFERNMKNKFGDTTPADYTNAGALTRDKEYVCTWGVQTASLPRPRMLRITFALDDALSRVRKDQTFEFVATLP